MNRKTGIAALASAAVVASALTATLAHNASAATISHPFPFHVTYKVGVTPSASQASRDAAVEQQYNSWKATYLVHGCASNEYYVSTKGDNDAPNNGTVSEAQGYGMNIVPLMAGYDANAQVEFNGLWQLVKNHRDGQGMMQWKLDGITCNYADSGTPDGATDGDLDIGYGLILADKQWGGYTADALDWLAKFYAADVASDGHLKCEDDGPTTDTRPSDHMLDHLRAFAAYDSAHDWNKVITKTQNLIQEFISAYSPTANLLSDFVVNANTTSPSPAPANYQENQPDNIVGFNSLRVPWHMGTDALLYGSPLTLSVATHESNSYKSHSGGDPKKVYPHTKLDGTPYNTEVAEEAGDSVGPSAMAAGDQGWTDTIWNYLATNPFGDAYFGETIKMIVYIVMAGDYWSPNDSVTPPPTSGSPTPSPTSSTPPPSNAIVNGGFETGDFTGWTRTGTTSIVSSPVHSGTHAVLLGSTNPTLGDSKVAQTFTAPSGATALSFWYNIHCPDEVIYDWATATLKDNTTGTTATVLGKTCTLNQGWKQNTSTVTAGHSYTLTLVSHDENSPGDATDTTYDDVVVNGSTAPGDDFSMSLSPGSGSVTAGQSATSTVSTAVTSGSAQSVALSAAGLPAGASASFNPSSVTAGGTSTLTLSTSASTPAGSYPITVTGTAASGAHSAGYTLTVTSSSPPPPPTAIVNGGFETGDFTGWTRTGTTAITTSIVHSGTDAVRLGSTNPTNGDSKVSQTFTAPTGTTRLSFFYNITCPDDVAWDWATATVKDNTTGVTTTVLGRTCTLNQGWQQASTAVTAGHSYTVTLVSHDENNPGDATYTVYDDVTLS